MDWENEIRVTTNWLNDPRDTALAQANAMIGEGRYSVEHKQREAAKILKDAHEEVQRRYAKEMASLDGKHSENERLVRRYLGADNADEAAMIGLERDIVLRTAARAKPGDMSEMWQGAIEDKRVPLVKVFLIYTDDIIEAQGAKRGVDGKFGSPAPFFREYDALVKASYDLLDTPEQKVAREWLEGEEQARATYRRAQAVALRALDAYYDGEKLVTAAQKAMQDRIRSTF